MKQKRQPLPRTKMIKCELIMEAEESRGDGDCGGNWTPRSRYIMKRIIKLPVAPTLELRLSNLLNVHECDSLVYVDDPEENDDEFFGWSLGTCTYDCDREMFCSRIFLTLLVPWESTIETMRERYPKWTFEFNAEASKGFDISEKIS